MSCCWTKLPYASGTTLLDSDAELQNVRWWDHHEGVVVMSYFENSGIYSSRNRQATFMGGRPGFIGNPTVQGINSVAGTRNPRGDLWVSLASALKSVLFHGPFLRREAVFSNGGLAQPDFMRTIKTSTAGGLLKVLFVLVPNLYRMGVRGDTHLGGWGNAPETPADGRFVMLKVDVENRDKSPDFIFRDQTTWADDLDAWAARENDKVARNPSLTGYATWRTEEADIFFQDIAAFGGHYGSTSCFYRAFGGERLKIDVDITRPAHFIFRPAPAMSVALGESTGLGTRRGWYLPVVFVDYDAWETARDAARTPGQRRPDLPSQAYMTAVAHSAYEWYWGRISSAHSGFTIEDWFNHNLQPDQGVISLWVNDTKVLYDGSVDRDWATIFRDLLSWQPVQEYSPPSVFIDLQQQTLPVGYLGYSSQIERGDVLHQSGALPLEEVPNADPP